MAAAALVVIGAAALTLAQDALAQWRQSFAQSEVTVARRNLFWLLLFAVLAASMISFSHLDDRAPFLSFLLRMAFDVCLPLSLMHNALVCLRSVVRVKAPNLPPPAGDYS